MYGGNGGYGGGGGGGTGEQPPSSEGTGDFYYNPGFGGGGGGGGYVGGNGGDAGETGGEDGNIYGNTAQGGSSYINSNVTGISNITGTNAGNGFVSIDLINNLFVGNTSSGQVTNISSGINTYASTFVGYNAGDTNNLLILGSTNAILTNSSDLYVGYSGSSNSMIISNGGLLADVNGWIGYSSSSGSNSVLVTSSNSLWTNSGTLTIGYEGNGTLTVANGGTVQASGGIIISSQSYSYGTLNIGEYGANDSAGTIVTPTITFGVGLSGGRINFNQTNSCTFAVPISGYGSLYDLGSGTTILIASNSYELGTTIAPNATLQVGNGSTNGQLGSGGILVNGTLNYDRSDAFTETNPISGGGGLYQIGSGTLILAGSNSFTGLTTIASGSTLQLGNGGTNGALSAGIGINNGGSLVYDRSDILAESNSISGSGSLKQIGSGTLILLGGNTYQGGTTIAANSTIQIGSGSPNGQLGSGGVMVNGSLFYDRTDVFTENNSISGGGGLYQSGSGTLILAGSNSFTGLTTIASGSTLQFGNGGTNGTVSKSYLPVGISNNGNLIYDLSTTFAESNSMSGTGTLTQNGSGTLILASSNTYSGGTTVNSGTLVINSSTGQTGGELTVNSGGTLGGNGVIGSTDLISNAVLLPGYNGSGTLTIAGTLGLEVGASAVFNISSKNSFDSINFIAGLGNDSFLRGSFQFNLTNYTPILGDEFSLVNHASDAYVNYFLTSVQAGSTDFTDNDGLWTGTNSGVTYQFNQTTGDLTVEAVPEPSTYALLGLGGLVAVVAWRRKVA